MNDNDVFSDHIPVEFQLKINYNVNVAHNNLVKLWNKLKNDKL